jgi:hypothetical protein
VPACCRQLERPPRALLPPHVGEVGEIVGRREVERELGLLGLPFAAQVRSRLGQMVQRHGLDPCKRGFRRRRRGAEQARQALPAGALGRREHAGDRTDAAVERELSDRGVAAEQLVGNLPRGGEHGKGDRQVEAGAFLAQLRGSEIDCQAAIRPGQLCRDDSAPHPLLRLLARTVG